MAQKQLIKFRYSHSPDFRRIPASGVIGSVNPQGQVVANIYTEMVAIPEDQVGEVDAEGHLTMQQTETEKVVEREIQISVVLPPAVARSFATWLVEKAELIEPSIKTLPS